VCLMVYMSAYCSRDMRKTTSMYTVMKQDGAKRFLESIARNSDSSKITYAVALSHMQKFLDDEHSPHTLQTILKALTVKEIDVYELLDEFVTYILKQRNGNDNSMSISDNTIKNYIAAIKSYLAYYDIDI